MIFSLCFMNQANIETSMKAIGARIKGHRIALNQTKKQVADILGISDATLTAIESGESVAFQFIIALAEYYSMPPAQLIDTERDIPEPTVLRERMAIYHTKKDKRITALLKKPPELTWSLDDLTKKGFFNEGKRVKDVAEKIMEYYEVEYTSPAISNALIKLVKEKKLVRVQEGQKNYLYLIK